MDEQAEGGPFPACAVLTGAPDWPGLGQGQMPLETASWDLFEGRLRLPCTCSLMCHTMCGTLFPVPTLGMEASSYLGREW